MNLDHPDLAGYALLATSSLFVIIDPIASVPAYLAMTAADTPQQRIRMARLACLVTAGLLLAFAIGGKYIFQFLGITIPASRKLTPARRRKTSPLRRWRCRCWPVPGP